MFWAMHDTRSWIMYPRYNYLDWAFYVAVLGSILCYVTAALFAIESRNAQAKRQRFTNLVYNMHHPQAPTNGFEQIPLKTPPGPPSGRPMTSPGGSSRFSRQHDIGSAHSSPYASISRFSQQPRTPKSPPQSPLSRQFTAV